MKQIDLEPTEYTVDIPNKKEPIFGPGLLQFLGAVVAPVLIFIALKFFGLR